MKFVSLTLANFRAHRLSEIHFSPRGVTGIIGTNGSGKSTVLEGAAWALYGSAAARGTKGSLRWKRATARRQAEAELVFDVRGERYRIQRKENDATLFLDATRAVIAAGTAPVNDYMPRLIGMTLAEFQATYMCQQKDLARLASMTPIERQQLLREVLGVGRIDRALDACRKRKNTLVTKAEGLMQGLGAREPLQVEYDAALSAVDATTKELEWARTALERARNETEKWSSLAQQSTVQQLAHRNAVERVAETQRLALTCLADVQSVERQIEAAEAASRQLPEQEEELKHLPALRAEAATLKAAEAAESEARTLRGQIAAARHDIGEYTALLEQGEKALAAFDAEAFRAVGERYRAIEGRLREQVSAREQRKATARAELTAANNELRALHKRKTALEALGADSPCPTCAQSLGERYSTVMAAILADQDRLADVACQAGIAISDAEEPTDEEFSLQAELEDLKAQGERMREQEKQHGVATSNIPNWTRHIETARERMATAEARLREIPSTQPDPQLLTAALNDIARLERLDASLGPARAAAANLEILRQNVLTAGEKHSKAHDAAQAAKRELAALAFDEREHTRTTEALSAAVAAENEAKAAVAKAEGAVGHQEWRRDRALEALDAYDRRAGDANDLTEQIRLHELAAERLDAFRRDQAASIRPELEILTSGLVSILTDGRHDSVTITDAFDCVLQESGVTMEVVSGGTEDIAAIAMRIAISQMIAQKAGHPLSLMVLDEPFGSLDAVRRGNVLALLRHLADTFEQVLLISHVEETRDSVDHVIEVTHDEAAGCCSVRCSFQAPAPTEQLEVAAA